MPLKKCTSNGQSGWKWGDSGHCYTGPGAKKKAIDQAVAINYSLKERGKKPEPISSEKRAEVKKYVKQRLRGDLPVKK